MRRAIRWFLSLFGRRCDFGTGHGEPGCLRAGRWANPMHKPPTWHRPLVWCDLHRMHWDDPWPRHSVSTREGGK